ncbi:PBSX family phage terminase large subunit [Psychrobacter pygoscelis]|uniref:PBSX family phage terminase large subunit n=1 Tax=Psychrobacter pygoscelis TaxID=2488563 RepID=UPI001038732A|nr:PBSX family phage terminase large subunit [Psychrobacter pygoscelis]
MNDVAISFPKKFAAFDKPSRYKFARGGRGSAKSWTVARKLLLIGGQSPKRILCTREVQKSIKQSVHQLLKDQVTALGLGGFYNVLETEIRGKNGTRIYFSGLSDQTVDSIKSFEGVDICWIEEGQAITDKSLKILAPTIRAKGSEIWVTYNPQLDTDPIHVLANSGRSDVITIDVNWYDNPWFPEVLNNERLEAKAALSKAEYEHIWEGKCMPAVEGAIYFNEIADAEAKGRVTLLPYDPMLKVHTIWDLGFNDSMFILFAQRLASEVRIIDAIEDNRRTLVSYVTEDVAPRNYNWGDDWLPHDGFAKRHQSGKSDAEVMRLLGRNVAQIPNMEVEAGIRRGREVFPRIYFNKESEGVMRLVECLKRYRRHVSKSTGEPSRPVHDEYSHGADAFRYLCIVSDKLTNHNQDDLPPQPIPTVTSYW